MENEKVYLLEAWSICAQGNQKDQKKYQKAFEFIENFKKTSPNAIDIAFSLVVSVDSFELAHFGLHLISDTIKFKWNSLEPNSKLEIKNKLVYLLSNLDINDQKKSPVYLKNTLCLTFLELVKREWPQNWPSLLSELFEISSKSPEQKNLVLIILKFIAEEFVSNEVPNIPIQRRKDIIQYLNANIEYVYNFLIQTLEEAHERLNNPSEQPINIKNSIMIANSCLNSLSFYVDWINLSFVFSRNYSLINIILNLLKNKEVCVESAKCLISILSRKGSLADKKPLGNLLNESLLNQVYSCIQTSLADKSFRDIVLKYLVTILISIGALLNSLWVEEKMQAPFDLNCFLNAIFELIINDNRLFSMEAIELWISLLNNEFLKKNETIMQATLNLSKIITSSKLLFKINPDSLIDEFNSEEDFRKFFQKYRMDLSKLIKLSASLYMEHFLNSAFEWASNLIIQTCNLSENDMSGYDSNSFLYLCWDALIFLWTSIMQILSKKIKENNFKSDLEMSLSKEKLISLIEMCAKFNSTNANFCSFNLSLLSAILVACELDNKEIILKTILLKHYNDFDLFQNKYLEIESQKTDANLASIGPILKYVQNLRRQLAANILNVCRSYASSLKDIFDDIYAKTIFLINNNHLTQIERIIFIQSLIFCSNEFNSFSVQSSFINQFLMPLNGYFLSDEVKSGLSNIDAFIKFIGLNESANETVSPTACSTLQNRRQIFYYINVLFGILKSVKVIDESGILNSNEVKILRDNGFIDANTNSFKNPAYSAYLSYLENILKLIKLMNISHSHDLQHALKTEYLDMTEAAKTLALGLNQAANPSSSNNNQTIDSNFSLSNEPSYYTDKILMFFYNTYETLSQLIALYFVKFKNELLFVETGQNSDSIIAFGDALFAGFLDLPDFRVRFLIKYALKSLLLFNFKQEHIERKFVVVKMNETLLEYFLPSILSKINKTLKHFQETATTSSLNKMGEYDNFSTQVNSNEFKNIQKQIIEENQFILLCRELVELVRIFFNFNNLISVSNKAEMSINDAIDNSIEDYSSSVNNENKDNVEFNNDETQKQENTTQISVLAAYFLNTNKVIFQSVILILFEGLNWPDSYCCLRLARFALTFLESVTIYNTIQNEHSIQKPIFYLNDNVSQQLFSYCINALQIHGEHNEIASLLTNLSFHIYEKFPSSCKDSFNNILGQISNLNIKLFQDFINSFKMINMKTNEKWKKETYKKLIQPVIGKAVGQIFKNNIDIRILKPLEFKTKKYSEQTSEINICSLFDSN